MSLDAYLRIKRAASVPVDKVMDLMSDMESDTNAWDKARLKFFQGQSLGHGYNGNPSVSDDGKTYTHSTHSLKSRGRQLAALGLSGLGAAGGAIGGHALSNALADKLGLGDEYDEKGKKKKKSLLKRLAKAGITAAGTIGGGAGGYALGTTAAGFMNGLQNDKEGIEATKLGEILARPKYRKAIKEYVRDAAKENGAGPVETYLAQRAALDWATPIKPW